MPQVERAEGPVQPGQPEHPARSADEGVAQVDSGDDAADPGQMQGDATGSAGGVQHGTSTAEMERTQDELGLLAADIVGL
jgi:hypothetical protein